MDAFGAFTGDAAAAPAGAPVEPGVYTFTETTPFGEIGWTVTINEDGTAAIDQPENEQMGNPHWDAKWKDNGDGTFTTYDCEGEAPQLAAFWHDNAITWTVNGDGTVTAVE